MIGSRGLDFLECFRTLKFLKFLENADFMGVFKLNR